MTIRSRQAGFQLERTPLHHEEINFHRHDAARETSSSFAHNNRRQRIMTWNSSRWLSWRLAVALSMIAGAAGHMHTETAPVDLEEEFFYAMESSDQSFDDSSRLEKDRSLQFFGQPQDLPTRAPVPFAGFPFFPTPAPTLAPQSELTPMPSQQITQRPSGLAETPTQRPTHSPSRQPTDLPTSDPTETPTRGPTHSPSQQPTESPTREPSEQPTRRPSLGPTSSPTRRPTVGPTGSPSRTPTDTPTGSPSTATPTTRPSLRPTRPPNNDPTLLPSQLPTANPSLGPTQLPTPIASAAPSLMLSQSPSLRPSTIPSSIPTNRPTARPSSSPSIAPSVSFQPSISSEPSLAPTPDFEFPLISLSAVRVIMEFSFEGDGRRLQEFVSSPTATEEKCTAIWVDYVTQSMESEVKQVIPRYETLRVQTDNVSKITFNDLGVLAFFYDVQIDIRSAINVHSLSRYIGGSFDSANERNALVEIMRASICPEYANILDLQVILPDKVKTSGASTTETETGSADSTANTGVIAGAVVAVAAVAILAAIFIFVRINRRQELFGENVIDATQSPGKSRAHENEIASEIGGEADLDVSTLGDPIPQGAFHSTGIGHVAKAGSSSLGYYNENVIDSGLQSDLEVSTLGDPIPTNAFPGTNIGDVSTSGSFNLDYDYEAYCNEESMFAEEAPGSGSDSLSNSLVPADDNTLDAQSMFAEEAPGGGSDSLSNTLSNSLVPADDNTLDAQYAADEQFEVLAPAGVLGLILETNKDGVPTITKIMPTSALADQVQIGDRLLTVDGIDVSVMLESDVSRLIAFRKEAPVRKFVFTKPMMGTGGFDEESQSMKSPSL